MSAMQFENNGIRFDLQIIASWIEPGSKVLDLGCGEGHLLHFLKKYKQVVGTGIERVEAKVAKCIEKGLSVVQGDINEEVLDYAEDTLIGGNVWITERVPPDTKALLKRPELVYIGNHKKERER